jgi:predicted negative regulator of RcsB-dependent stress response
VEIYNSEEEQIAALARWWKANGVAALAGIAIGIALIVGWNLWKSHRYDRSLQASALYEQLLVASDAGQNESAQKISERLIAEFDGSVYAVYAGLFQAKLKVAAGDLTAAKKILQTLTESADDELKHVARLRLLQLMLANGEYEQGLQLIAAVDPASAQGFSAAYDELSGDLYAALKRLDEARTAYQNAQREGQGSPLLQFKIDDITPPETIQTTK